MPRTSCLVCESNVMKCCRSSCDLTHCSVARLGSRWALTLAPHCVQLIWTRTACRTCWWELPCTASSGTRARCLCTSARATWVGRVGQRERSSTTCRLILLHASARRHLLWSSPKCFPHSCFRLLASVCFYLPKLCWCLISYRLYLLCRFASQIAEII